MRNSNSFTPKNWMTGLEAACQKNNVSLTVVKKFDKLRHLKDVKVDE
jgi:hypothetical protein